MEQECSSPKGSTWEKSEAHEEFENRVDSTLNRIIINKRKYTTYCLKLFSNAFRNGFFNTAMSSEFQYDRNEDPLPLSHCAVRNGS